MFAGKLNDVLFRNDISQSKTNHCNSDFSFIKIRVAPFDCPLQEVHSEHSRNTRSLNAMQQLEVKRLCEQNRLSLFRIEVQV